MDFAAATAGLGPGAVVLEIGCGTGQLTERLAGRGYHLTAIDVGPAMIAARARLAAAGVPTAGVTFQVIPFEDLERADGSFDLVVSGAAFHWIDPEIAFTKPARLLRPGGWLALFGTEERYGEPLDAALEALGVGWSADERRAAGTDGYRPGELLDETLDVLTAAWGPDPVSYQSTRGTVTSALVRPKPLAPIPVLLGGGQSPRALDRIARRAQGWLVVAVPPAAAGQTWQQITTQAAAYGRDPADLQFIYQANFMLADQALPGEGRFPFTGDLAQICADAALQTGRGPGRWASRAARRNCRPCGPSWTG